MLNPKKLQSALGASGLKRICALQLSDEHPDANSARKGFAVLQTHLMVNLKLEVAVAPEVRTANAIFTAAESGY